MREIKFRAWTDRNWFIENYCYLDKNNHFFGEDLTNGLIVKILAVEQFTGLHDCDGKEIYEGDILLIPEGYGGDYHYHEIECVVKYDAPCFFVECGQEFNWCDTKIIGNSHEAKQ